MCVRPLSVTILGLWLLCGCGGGRLLILLDRPTDDPLNPLKDSRLTKFSLRVSQNGQTTDQEAFRGPDPELVVGVVPTDAPFDLRLAAKSAADEILGLGFVRDVEAAGGLERSVKVYFRKPVGYIGGQNRVVPLNTAAGAGETPELATIELAGVHQVADVATTPNGAWLLVAADSALVPVLTANHSVLEPVKLKAPVGCVAVSPDSRYAVVCHQTAVSIVELARIGTPDVPYRTVAVPGGAPARIAFAADRRTAYVLVNALGPLDACPGAASLLGKLDLDAPAALAPDSLQRPVADLAVDPRDGGLLFTLPCAGTGALGRLLNNAVEVLPPNVPAPSDIAIAEKSFLVAGGLATVSDRMQVVRFDLTTPGFDVVDDRNLPFPPLEVRFRNLSAGTGYFSWISVPSNIRIHRLAVSPDARRAVALFRADYASNISLSPCTFRAQSQAAGYMILDLATNAIVLFRLTRLRIDDCFANCLINPAGQTLDNLQRCSDEYRRTLQSNQLLVPSEFEPASSALLFGG